MPQPAADPPPLGTPLFIQARRTPAGWHVEAGWSVSEPPRADLIEEHESRIGRAIDRIARIVGAPPTAAAPSRESACSQDRDPRDPTNA